MRRDVVEIKTNMTDSFEVRDHRNKAMFRVDDEYLNGYSKLCGVNSTMVYLCLCRHADRHQESFPSVRLMAEKTGVSERSVIRGIQTLIEWNIISKERERKPDAKWLNNRYVLLDKSVWKPKPKSQVPESHLDSQVTETTEPSATDDKSQVPHSHTKVAHIKDTHTKEGKATALQGNEWHTFIDLFKPVNPLFEDFYKNKTERSALDSLAQKIGKDKLQSLLLALPEITGKRYAPKITKPSELKRDIGKLLVYIKQESETVGKYQPKTVY